VMFRNYFSYQSSTHAFSEMYRDNLSREEFKETTKSLTFLDFINSLEISSSFESHPHGGGMVTEELSRVAQMTR
jgi:hypothetical protein